MGIEEIEELRQKVEIKVGKKLDTSIMLIYNEIKLNKFLSIVNDLRKLSP